VLIPPQSQLQNTAQQKSQGFGPALFPYPLDPERAADSLAPIGQQLEPAGQNRSSGLSRVIQGPAYRFKHQDRMIPTAMIARVTSIQF
jgi:hypothetical protein